MTTDPAPAGLIGRDREIDTLRRLLGRACAGSGSLVLCVGEPGIGKTRLAQELAGAALAAGTPVAWGRCAETAGAPPYWPWRQVLRSLRLDPDALLAGDATSPQERFEVFDTVTDALVGVAAGPCPDDVRFLRFSSWPTPAAREEEQAMEHITIVLDAPVGSVRKLEKLMAEIGREPEGLVARYAGTVDGRLGIVGIWDSKADADRFFTQQLGPALAKALGPEPAGLPQEKRLDVEHRYVRNG